MLLKEFEEQWAAALPIEGYAVIRLSPRKWGVLRDLNSRCLDSNNRFRSAPEYRLMETFKYAHEAREYVAGLALEEVTKKILKQGKAYLITLSDAQLQVLPFGPIKEAGLEEYVTKRLSHIKGE